MCSDGKCIKSMQSYDANGNARGSSLQILFLKIIPNDISPLSGKHADEIHIGR